MSQKIAFFDVDGTVFRSSLLIELVNGLIAKEVFPADTRGWYEQEFTAWRNREGTYESYIAAVIKAYLHHIKGVYYGDLADVGKEVVAGQSKHVYRYTRDLIQKLRKQDYYVVAISQSPKTILDKFCAEYGFDKVYGRMYELGPQDKFTGDMFDEHLIENKANIIARVIEKEDVITDASVGVGDTEGDIPLLEQVSQPICFNPNQKLYDHALRMGWKVVIERKDVIYEL